MAVKDAKEFVDLVTTNPRKAAKILFAIVLIVVIGVWAKAFGEVTLELLEKVPAFFGYSQEDLCKTVDPLEMGFDLLVECEQKNREGD